MEDESQAEDIANGIIFGLHILDVDDFRSHIARSTASHEEILLSIRELSQSEIGNDAVPAALCAEDKVLRLKITMHDPLGVHFLESLQDGVDDQFDLEGFEFVFCLDLIIELSSFQELNNDIERILGLKDFMKFHAVFVVKVPHDFDLLDEALLSFVLTVGCLLGEGFDRIVPSTLQLLSEVDRGEISLSDFLLGLELLMEASLVEFPFQNFPAGLKIGFIFEGELCSFLLFFEVDSEGGEGEAVLEVEIEEHGLLEFGGGLDEALLKEGEGDLSFGGAVGEAGVEQLAWVVRHLMAEHRGDCFHFNIIQKFGTNLLYSNKYIPVIYLLPYPRNTYHPSPVPTPQSLSIKPEKSAGFCNFWGKQEGGG